MTTFKERENQFESKFAHDEQLRFKADARANKILALWAAEMLGRDGDSADAYVKEVIMADFEEPGREDVFRKVAGDLKGLAEEAAIRAKMDESLAEAKAQLMTEAD